MKKKYPILKKLLAVHSKSLLNIFASVCFLWNQTPLVHASVNFSPEETTIFCDLGNTLVNTDKMSKPGENPVLKTVRWMKSVPDFLSATRKSAIRLGMITNVPKTWKQEDLKTFLNERWAEDNAFVWSYFEGRIQMPSPEVPSKPDPLIFQKAKRLSPSRHYIYLSENLKEIQSACKQGYYGYRFKTALENFTDENEKTENQENQPSPFNFLSLECSPTFPTPGSDQLFQGNLIQL